MQGYKKIAHWKKITKMQKKKNQIALFGSKSATESLNSYIVSCFDLHSRWCYRLDMYVFEEEDYLIAH